VTYVSSSEQPKWTRTSASSPINLPICQAAALGVYFAGLPPFRRWLWKASQTVPGGVHETASGRCQEWIVLYPDTPGEDENFCLGVDDHLPRTFRLEGVNYEYSGWNAPIDFPVPKVD